ncbi:MAG: acetylornithine/succinylornithine family transaminase [Bacteroidetes bacterium]|nr:acetylornithine/succinylornithine family transaminase [Bacteroidota bacterium]MBU1116087.1 acetylornithine/succinylornithine family transaminase [Bacteroidota bacterium]MBU1799489.1 acetylornithine/succinylornithine family transaminase [Bacteroidota bacterium]
MRNFRELIDNYEVAVYPKRDLVIVKGKDATVWDEKGNEFIDCAAGIGVATIGHSNPDVVKAITKQAETLITNACVFYNDTRALFLEKLNEITPANLKRSFLTNSGTEAMEAAIKFTRVSTGKTDFITTMKGFHGRTMGALSGTHKEEYRTPFEPLVPGFSFVPFNNLEKMEEAITEKTAGIILEVIQGEGGINIASQAYLEGVRSLCYKNNILLIIDEIQSGFCRTGKMFAIEHFGIDADILTVAKGIAGGFPVGAAICSDKVKIGFGQHGTTFGGNPLASAAGLAAITFMQETNLAKQAKEKGDYFVSKLNVDELSKVREVRHKGLMIGIELKEKVQPILQQLMEENILAMPAGKIVLRMLPPAVITYEQLDKVAEVLNRILK